MCVCARVRVCVYTCGIFMCSLPTLLICERTDIFMLSSLQDKAHKLYILTLLQKNPAKLRGNMEKMANTTELSERFD